MSKKPNFIEYWKIPEALAEQQKPLADELNEMVQAKILKLQEWHLKALTEKQRETLNKDIELMGKYSEMIDLLTLQLQSLANDYIALCDKQTELINENNQLKTAGLNKIATELKTMNHELTQSRKQL